MQTTTQNQNIVSKKPSSGSSKTGAVLSVIALIFAAIGSALIHSKYKPVEAVTTTAQKVDVAVAGGTWHVLATLFGVPLLAIGICLGLLAILVTVVRLRKVKAGGFIFSVLWILLGIWAIKISTAAFKLISAHRVN